MEKRGAHEMRRAPCSFGSSVGTAMPHCKKDRIDSGEALDQNNSSNRQTMEDSSNAQGRQLKQPKKRFVGRRTADAQVQKDSTSQADVESTAVQRGMHGLSVVDGATF